MSEYFKKLDSLLFCSLVLLVMSLLIFPNDVGASDISPSSIPENKQNTIPLNDDSLSNQDTAGVACPEVCQDYEGELINDSNKAVFQVEAEFGYVVVAGNSETRTINGSFHAERDSRKHKHKVDFSGLNSSTDEENDAEQYYSEIELGKKLNEVDLVIAKMKYEADRFSSYEYQSSFSMGFRKRLYENMEHWLDVSAGPGFRRSKIRDGEGEDGFIVSFELDYQYPFNETAKFNEEVDVEVGADNASTRSVSSIGIKIAERLSLKLGLTTRFNSRKPADAESADKTSSMTLIYSF